MYCVSGLLIFYALHLLFTFLFTAAPQAFQWDKGADILHYLETHPWESAALVVLGLILINIAPIIRNLKKQHLMRLTFMEQEGTLLFELISLYSSKPKQKKISVKEVVFEGENVKIMGEGKMQSYHFAEPNKGLFAIIDPRNPIWASHRAKIRPGLEKLQRILSHS